MNDFRIKMDYEIPVTAHTDVLVIGGGPGGFAAAATAARNGAKTILAEQNGQLGGMACAGAVQPFMMNHMKGETLDRPVFAEWVRRMRVYTPDTLPLSDNLGNWSDLEIISPDAAMLAAEDLCLDAGVTLRYHHTFIDILRNGNHLNTAVFHGKDGFSAISAKVFIDATGDGDVAAAAGCSYEFGDGKGDCQPMTTFFRMSGIAAERADREMIDTLYRKAKQEGRISRNPKETVWTGYLQNVPSDSQFNSTRITGKNPLKAAELSDAEIEGRIQVRELFHFLRNEVKGYERAQLASIARTVGVRESRRVFGRYYLTLDDYDAMRKFPDAIARVHYPVDIHHSKGDGCTHRQMPENDWYEIPYGAIVAKDRDNLLLGSRCLSADHAVNSSLRIMPVICSVGQAAGMAGAISIKTGKNPDTLNGKDIRGKLIAYGARLGLLQ